MKYENTCYDEFNININKLTDCLMQDIDLFPLSMKL